MRSYRAPGPGTVVVISDFLTETDVHEGLQSLALYGDRVAIIQILGPEELHPDFAGDWQLIDVESDASVDVTVAQRSVHRYLANLAEHTEGLRETCRRLGVAFVRLSSADSLQEVLIPSLLSAGVVR
jgi:hypothetical protein